MKRNNNLSEKIAEIRTYIGSSMNKKKNEKNKSDLHRDKDMRRIAMNNLRNKRRKGENIEEIKRESDSLNKLLKKIEEKKGRDKKKAMIKFIEENKSKNEEINFMKERGISYFPYMLCMTMALNLTTGLHLKKEKNKK